MTKACKKVAARQMVLETKRKSIEADIRIDWWKLRKENYCLIKGVVKTGIQEKLEYKS